MTVFEEVSNILKELSVVKKIHLKSNLQNDLGLDSLNLVTLLLEIEEVFNIELDESDMNPFELTDVEHVVWLVEKYRGKENAEND